MGCWRICQECGHGQNRITVEDLQAVSWDAQRKVTCVSCGAEREDDSPEDRMVILTEEIVALKERTAKITSVLKRVASFVGMRKPKNTRRP